MKGELALSEEAVESWPSDLLFDHPQILPWFCHPNRSEDHFINLVDALWITVFDKVADAEASRRLLNAPIAIGRRQKTYAIENTGLPNGLLEKKGWVEGTMLNWNRLVEHSKGLNEGTANFGSLHKIRARLA